MANKVQRKIQEKTQENTVEELVKKIHTSLFEDLDLIQFGKYRPSWDEYFMMMAKIAATRATCLSRPGGAVIVKDRHVIATGYVGSMPGTAQCTDEGSCFRRRFGASDAGKYDVCRSVHSEENAIAQAAKKGISVEGAVIYSTLYPCYRCSKLLASAGIKKVYYEYEYKSPDVERDKVWRDALAQANIEIEQVVLSDETIIKAIIGVIMQTSWRRELLPTGEPTGRIENLNMETMYKH